MKQKTYSQRDFEFPKKNLFKKKNMDSHELKESK